MKCFLGIFLVLFGLCQSCENPNPPISTNELVEKHVLFYVNSINRTNTTISISLRYFVNDLQVNEPKNWVEVESRETIWISHLSNNKISLDYPVKPSPEEIIIIDRFLDYFIWFGKNYQRINPENIGENLSVISKKYIKSINDFEYENHKQINQ